MKKALPIIYYILCAIIYMLVAILIMRIFNFNPNNWHIVLLIVLMNLVIPHFKNAETQSGTKLQVKWLFSKPFFVK